MKIGLPKALLYYRYSQLWEAFFGELGCEVVTSLDTTRETVTAGAKNSVDENCLPLKIFMGHVQSLIGNCDYILIPRFARVAKDDEFCIRFWGLPDIVRNTFKEVSILSYNIDSKHRAFEKTEFIKLGRAIGKSPAKSLHAYYAGLDAQHLYDSLQRISQYERLNESGYKILISSQPYVIHDPYVGGIIKELVVRQGGVLLYSDCCHRPQCRALSKELSSDLYWVLNKEIIGAIKLYENHVDGIILLTAFPCGADSLVNELVIRKVKGVPLIQILMDEHTAPAGLETRIESFMDILQQRKAYAKQA